MDICSLSFLPSTLSCVILPFENMWVGWYWMRWFVDFLQLSDVYHMYNFTRLYIYSSVVIPHFKKATFLWPCHLIWQSWMKKMDFYFDLGLLSWAFPLCNNIRQLNITCESMLVALQWHKAHKKMFNLFFFFELGNGDQWLVLRHPS